MSQILFSPGCVWFAFLHRLSDGWGLVISPVAPAVVEPWCVEAWTGWLWVSVGPVCLNGDCSVSQRVETPNRRSWLWNKPSTVSVECKYLRTNDASWAPEEVGCLHRTEIWTEENLDSLTFKRRHFPLLGCQMVPSRAPVCEKGLKTLLCTNLWFTV